MVDISTLRTFLTCISWIYIFNFYSYKFGFIFYILC